MKKLLALCALAVLALGLTSCFEYKAAITVNKDGSATLEEVAMISAQMKAMLAGAPGGDDPEVYGSGLILDKAKAEARAKLLGEGVTLKSHEEVALPDGKTGVKMTYAIVDINKLRFRAGGKLKNPSDPSHYTTFVLNGNSLTINNPEKKPDAPMQPTSEEQKKKKRAQLPIFKAVLPGGRFSVEVKAAGGFASTDATFATGDTVTLLDVDLDKLVKNDDHLFDFLDAFESNMTATQVAAKFKGVDAVKLEVKEVIKTELK